MAEPIFLTVEDVLEIHADQISNFGGGDPAVLDLHMLESAVAAPEATWDGKYLLPDVHAMAAAYLFHIVQNHAFADGNKRTGAAAALIFLDLNDAGPLPPELELEDVVWKVAQAEMNRDQIAEFFRKHAR